MGHRSSFLRWSFISLSTNPGFSTDQWVTCSLIGGSSLSSRHTYAKSCETHIGRGGNESIKQKNQLNLFLYFFARSHILRRRPPHLKPPFHNQYSHRPQDHSPIPLETPATPALKEWDFKGPTHDGPFESLVWQWDMSNDIVWSTTNAIDATFWIHDHNPFGIFSANVCSRRLAPHSLHSSDEEVDALWPLLFLHPQICSVCSSCKNQPPVYTSSLVVQAKQKYCITK